MTAFYQMRNTPQSIASAIQRLKAVTPEVNHWSVLQICDQALDIFKQSLLAGDRLNVPIPVLYSNGIAMAIKKLEAQGFKASYIVTKDGSFVSFNFDISDGWKIP